MKSPILIIAFNRPETTRQVFRAVRAVKPEELFFAVDGARDQNSEDVSRISEVQSLASLVDWNCQIKTLFRRSNLGCKIAVSEAISWFFEHVESGIILEDDCVPHASFFRFAEELLERYKSDERVMMISGDNFQSGRPRTPYSYYFSRYTHIWGWASWRRAWSLYDHGMKAWAELRDGGWLLDVLGDRQAVDYWSRIFEETYSERNTSWAYRWMFSAWSQSGLTVLPNVNLVSNIGFGDGATHTLHKEGLLSRLEPTEIAFPLRHPPFTIRDVQADAFTQRKVFSTARSWRSVAGRAYRAILRRP